MSVSEPQAAIRRKLISAARSAKQGYTRSGQPLPRAFFVTDPVRTPNLLAVVKRLPRGFGVIWRHYGNANRLVLGRQLARACHRRGLVLLVSADPDLAARIGAHGVHWPEKTLTAVRTRLPGRIETASAHSTKAIANARRAGVDAVIVSAVFSSRSPSAGEAIGANRFRQIARLSPLPVYALGGINARNAASVMQHAAGWAAIEAVMEGWAKP